jgi:hypothetical protein
LIKKIGAGGLPLTVAHERIAFFGGGMPHDPKVVFFLSPQKMFGSWNPGLGDHDADLHVYPKSRFGRCDGGGFGGIGPDTYEFGVLMEKLPLFASDAVVSARCEALAGVWRSMPKPKPLPPGLLAGQAVDAERVGRMADQLARVWQPPTSPLPVSFGLGVA